MESTQDLAAKLVATLKGMSRYAPPGWGLPTNWTIATVESCTGGALANAITDIPGASEVFKYGWVTYSDDAKRTFGSGYGNFGSMDDAIRKHTVYSPDVALEMARSGQTTANSEIAIGITGTLNREDPANPGVTQGSVNIAIYTVLPDADCQTHVHMAIPVTDRRTMKDQIVHKVLETTLALLREVNPLGSQVAE